MIGRTGWLVAICAALALSACDDEDECDLGDKCNHHDDCNEGVCLTIEAYQGSCLCFEYYCTANCSTDADCCASGWECRDGRCIDPDNDCSPHPGCN